ncbi:MAG: hypothetical protein M3Z26_12205 [Bacteroidota bacterium]|nr:hypothetical protein [Bacteroidota bacterium]
MAFFLFVLFACSCKSPVHNSSEKITDVPPIAPKDTFHLLCQYWQLTDADHPTSKDISFKDENGIQLQSGITFMTDSAMLENPKGGMTYGKFELKGNTINVDFDNGRKAIYKIGRLDNSGLWLKRTENKLTSQLTFKGSATYWPDATKDPFSKQNYQWTKKPKNIETDEALRKRLKDNVQFYAYYFTGFINGGAKEIDFTDLPNCLNWYAGGITIQNENKLNKKWINCFYSQDQAFKARQILENTLSKKYNWDSTQTNWLKQMVPVLHQIRDSL